MIQKLINPSKTDDVLFLSGVVLNILNEKVEGDGKSQNMLPELFSTMGLTGTINLIKYFGGEKIKIPSHEEMYQSFLILVCYYKRRVEHKSWDVIKEEVGPDVKPHTLGKIIKTFPICQWTDINYYDMLTIIF